MRAQAPSVFISYAWEDEAHTDWVRRLAGDLVRAGVDVTLDQWHLHPGDDIAAFMADGLERARYTLLVCTPEYARRFDARVGGVAHEADLVLGELLTRPEARGRVVPLLRAGTASTAVPRYLRSRLYVDFTDNGRYDASFDQLVRRLFNAPKYAPPEQGTSAFTPGPEEGAEEGAEEGGAGLASPKAWVLVAGTGREWGLPEKLQATSEALGRMLAERGLGVVTGGWPGVDALVARSFARALTRQGGALEDFLTQVVVETAMPAYPAGNLVLVRRGRDEWSEGVKRADAVVLVGGVGGTWTTGEYALRAGKAVFPLADTGGDALKFYMHMLKSGRADSFFGIDRKAFQAVAREAPGVVDHLAPLLLRTVS